MHIKITRRSFPTWPEPSPLSVVVVQLSMLTLTALVAVANMYFLYVSKERWAITTWCHPFLSLVLLRALSRGDWWYFWSNLLILHNPNKYVIFTKNSFMEKTRKLLVSWRQQLMKKEDNETRTMNLKTLQGNSVTFRDSKTDRKLVFTPYLCHY